MEMNEKVLVTRERLKGFHRVLTKPIGYRTVFSILLVTGLMTTLFWRSQLPEVMDYSNGIQALSEFKYFDEKLDEQLESSRSFRTPDPSMILSTVVLLRGLGSNLDQFFAEQSAMGDFSPDSLVHKFDHSLVVRTIWAERLVHDRSELHDRVDSLRVVLLDSLQKGKAKFRSQLNALWCVRAGELVNPDSSMHLIFPLLVENQHQMAVLRSLHDASVQIVVDDLISQYREQLRATMHLKERMNQAFYALSILTLLAVVALLVRITR